MSQKLSGESARTPAFHVELLKGFIAREESGLLIFLILLIILFTALQSSFLTMNNIVNVIRQVAILAIAAFGATYVILSQGLDLSVGSVSALAGVAAALVARELGPVYGPWTGYLIGMLVGIAAGLLNGLIITVIGINPIITTLGTMTVIRGLAFILTGGVSLYGVPPEFQWLGRSYLLGELIPVPVVLMIIIFGLGYIGLNNSFLGRYVYAIGGNEEAAHLSGIPVRAIKITVYVIGGLTAALSGITLASRLGAGQAGAGTGFELDVITAVILGGVSITGGEGRMEGTLLGVFIIGVLSNGLILLNVEPFYQLVIKGLALLVAVGLDRLRKRVTTTA
jgi:ribose transport system permease protein